MADNRSSGHNNLNLLKTHPSGSFDFQSIQEAKNLCK